MKKEHKIVRSWTAAAALLATLALAAPPRAHAVSKEIVALQTQVQQLMDMVQRLQSTLDTRFGALQQVVQQTADEANQMTQVVSDLQKKINTQNDGVSGKVDAVSGQVQSLNDSVDELKTRIARLDKQLQDIQSQLQNIQSAPPPGTMPGATMPGGAMQPGSPNGAPASDGGQGAGMAPATGPAVNPAPPLQTTYQAALRDFNAAKYSVAEGEFGDVVHYYPNDDLAGSSQFYLGEINYREKHYDDAIKAYNAVLEGFGGSIHAPAAQLHKALSLLQLDKRESCIQELRSLIRRYPQSSEAQQARSKLNGMGVRITPK
jgi:tol-pal system protein YbgF